MNKVNWGIIGCGDVTEIKSGPAFNKVSNSSLVAVMRRDAEKAKDYAKRHRVPKWYSNANQLINDPDVNAIYVATPPSSHEEYTVAALHAGKPVYVEKPMSVNAASSKKMVETAASQGQKLVVAHYRRAQPFFKKIRRIIADKMIGEVRLAKLEFYKRAFTREDLQDPQKAWRVNQEIAGGGIFHDLAPHQLDIMYHIFGDVDKVSGIAVNQAKVYNAADMVTGTILFKSGTLFNGVWCFNTGGEERDQCEIIGAKGKVRFSFFENKPVELTVDNKTESFVFDPIQHVQQPMIEQVVEYFLDNGPNPCSGKDGLEVMTLIDQIAGDN